MGDGGEGSLSNVGIWGFALGKEGLIDTFKRIQVSGWIEERTQESERYIFSQLT